PGGRSSDIRASGALSLRAIAAELNARGIRTRRGGQWGVSNAGALIGRLARRM
ncbi:recombinase family protein, partial [Tabrizicola sp. KVB23]|nr:recombinase family protein [Fuscibacter oryzae]